MRCGVGNVRPDAVGRVLSAPGGAEVPLDFCQAGAGRRNRRPAAAHRLGNVMEKRYSTPIPERHACLPARRFRAVAPGLRNKKMPPARAVGPQPVPGFQRDERRSHTGCERSGCGFGEHALTPRRAKAGERRRTCSRRRHITHSFEVSAPNPTSGQSRRTALASIAAAQHTACSIGVAAFQPHAGPKPANGARPQPPHSIRPQHRGRSFQPAPGPKPANGVKARRNA